MSFCFLSITDVSCWVSWIKISIWGQVMTHVHVKFRIHTVCIVVVCLEVDLLGLRSDCTLIWLGCGGTWTGVILRLSNSVALVSSIGLAAISCIRLISLTILNIVLIIFLIVVRSPLNIVTSIVPVCLTRNLSPRSLLFFCLGFLLRF